MLLAGAISWPGLPQAAGTEDMKLRVGEVAPDFKLQYFAANGYFVFVPNFRSSTGYGDAFKWATWGAWGCDLYMGVRRQQKQSYYA